MSPNFGLIPHHDFFKEECCRRYGVILNGRSRLYPLGCIIRDEDDVPPLLHTHRVDGSIKSIPHFLNGASGMIGISGQWFQNEDEPIF